MVLTTSLFTGFVRRKLDKPLTYSLPFWLIFYALFFWPSVFRAQNWVAAQSFGDSRQSLEVLLNTEQLGLLIGLTFTDRFFSNQVEITSKGEEDILLLGRGEAGELNLLLHGGSVRADELDALAVDPQGNLILAGAFWSSIDFGPFQLSSSPESPRALFLLKVDRKGDLIWGHTFEGGSIKKINDLVLDEKGNVFIGGYFDQELRFAGASLISTAESSAFYARFRENGELDWSSSFGDTGNTRTSVVEQFAGRRYLLAGFYDDTLKVAEQNFPANTNDEDAFLLALDKDGQVEWVRKAGGVFDESPRGIALDESGHVYLTGQIVGVLVVDDSTRIESRDGNADCFIIRYDSLGRADWAQSFGGDQLQLTNDLLYREGQIWLTGHYQENLKIGSLALQASAPLTFEGFLARLDTNGQARDLVALPGRPGVVLSNQITPGNEGGIWLGGDFSGQLNLGDAQLASPPGTFRSFIAKFHSLISSTPFQQFSTPRITLFPNPTRDQVWIHSEAPIIQYSIWDVQGRCLLQAQPITNRPIRVGGWPPGLYYIQVQLDHGITTLPFVIR